MLTRKYVPLAFGVLAWLAAIGIGFAALQRYAATPGTAQAPGDAIGELVAQHRVPGHGLIVMAIHPRCPCTDASLAELGDLLARSRGTCTALLLEYRPARPNTQWPQSTGTRTLGGVPVPILADAGGKLGAALGAQTSGHLVFADAQGNIRFHGGITLSRGHRGRSPAQDAILAILAGQEASLASAPVHGCALAPECRPDSAQ